MRDIAQFLQLFNQATEILSGASYSTSALVLLFKSEICRVLSPSDGDSHILEEFKSNMRTRIDYRTGAPTQVQKWGDKYGERSEPKNFFAHGMSRHTIFAFF
jgi:hypothetical protein